MGRDLDINNNSVYTYCELIIQHSILESKYLSILLWNVIEMNGID
jgi:hypothetical protein